MWPSTIHLTICDNCGYEWDNECYGGDWLPDGWDYVDGYGDMCDGCLESWPYCDYCGDRFNHDSDGCYVCANEHLCVDCAEEVHYDLVANEEIDWNEEGECPDCSFDLTIFDAWEERFAPKSALSQPQAHQFLDNILA